MGEPRGQQDAPVGDGAFAGFPVSPPVRTQDGLSNTLAFSEKPIGSGAGGKYSPFRDWVMVSWAGDPGPGQWLTVCGQLSAADLVNAQFNEGATWMLPAPIYTTFYASAPPDSRVPDCGTSSDGYGLSVARSYHPAGVNAAMADGSVRWFSSGINPQIWRALGTRTGGEIVDTP